LAPQADVGRQKVQYFNGRDEKTAAGFAKDRVRHGPKVSSFFRRGKDVQLATGRLVEVIYLGIGEQWLATADSVCEMAVAVHGLMAA
jgi:hypothetical protein